MNAPYRSILSGKLSSTLLSLPFCIALVPAVFAFRLAFVSLALLVYFVFHRQLLLSLLKTSFVSRSLPFFGVKANNEFSSGYRFSTMPYN